jgi:hypothetical protein
MEAAQLTQMLESNHHIAWCNKPEYHNYNLHHCENLKSCIYLYVSGGYIINISLLFSKIAYMNWFCESDYNSHENKEAFLAVCNYKCSRAFFIKHKTL